jgi:hypothetical protein
MIWNQKVELKSPLELKSSTFEYQGFKVYHDLVNLPLPPTALISRLFLKNGERCSKHDEHIRQREHTRFQFTVTRLFWLDHSWCSLSLRGRVIIPETAHIIPESAHAMVPRRRSEHWHSHFLRIPLISPMFSPN